MSDLLKKHPYTFCFHLVPVEHAGDGRRLLGSGLLAACPTVTMEAELYWYISDSLRWIPTDAGTLTDVPFRWPVITSEGADAACQVFKAWRELFKLSPEAVELTGSYTMPTDQPGAKEGGHVKIRSKRETLVALFDSLIDFAEQAKTGAYLIYWSDLHKYK